MSNLPKVTTVYMQLGQSGAEPAISIMSLMPYQLHLHITVELIHLRTKSQYLQILFNATLFVQRHLLFMLFVISPLCSLQIEPHVRECLDVRQQRLDERMKLFLYTK